MGIVSACALGPEHPAARAEGLHGIRLSAHEHAMRLAIEIGKRNPVALFGAVIVRRADGAVSASGLNDSRANPTLHGEIVAIDDYVARHGNRGWGEQILYTTAELCPMCMSALVWAGIGGVVYGTSIERLRQVGFHQIGIAAASVIAAAPFYHGGLCGGVLAAETDALFASRKRT